MRKLAIIGIFLLGTWVSSDAQIMSKEKDDSQSDSMVDDSRKPRIRPKIASPSDFENGLDTFYLADTSFRNTHRYNPVYKNFKGVQDLGFYGSAYKPLLFDIERTAGFESGENSYLHMSKSPKNSKFYESQVPFTKFNYVQGKEGTINLKAFHSQNILPNWNVAMDYSSLKNDGIYLRQEQKLKSTQLTSKYSSLNGKYLLSASMNWNRFFFQESGGITNDTLFEEADNLNKTVPVNLLGAQNTMKNREHEVFQLFKFGKMRSKIRLKDTIDYVEPKFMLEHRVNWKRESVKFNDIPEDFGIFPKDSLYNPNETSDSTTYNRLRNTFGINIPLLAKNGFSNFRIAGIHEHFTVHQGDSILERDFNIGLTSSLTYNKNTFLFPKVNINATYYSFGHNKNDLEFIAKGTVLKKGNKGVKAKVLLSSLKPHFAQNRFRSNHYEWNNNFDHEDRLSFSILGYHKSKNSTFKVKFTQDFVDNFVYYNSDGETQQHLNEQIQVSKLSLTANFAFGGLHLNNRVFLQNISNTDIVRLPELVSEHQIYLESHAFDKALKYQLGGELFFHSAYQSDSYNPVARQFYLQNQVETGDYPLVNIFLNLEIKTMKLFFELEHATQGLFGDRYYGTAHYPINPRRFVFGMAWDMFY